MTIKIFSAILAILVLFSFFLVACDVDIPRGNTTSNYSGETGTTTTKSSSGNASSTESQNTLPSASSSSTKATETGTPTTATTSVPVTTTTFASGNDGVAEFPVVKANSVDAFFNDSVFVGHSIMLGFSNYISPLRNSITGLLGTSKFFCSGSFGVENNKASVSDSSVHPKFQGQKYRIQEVIGVMGAKRVFLNCFALNDLALFGNPSKCSRLHADSTIDLIEEIKTMYPSVEIVVLTATYVVKAWSGMASLNNENISKFNSYMLEYCTEKGYDFVDIASPLLSNKGYMADIFCSDNQCHINAAGYKGWVATLRNYAAAKQNGTYKNPESIKILSKN